MNLKAYKYFLIILTLSVLFYNLGGYALIETTDSRYITMSSEMNEIPDYLIPHVNTFKHLHKPPFVYWMGALGLKIFGKNEFGGRFMLAVFALLTIYLIYFFTLRLFKNEELSLNSVFISISTILLIFGARGMNTDIFLLFFISFSLFSYVIYLKEDKLQYIYLFWFNLSMAMLVKGPVPLIIITLILCSYHLLPGERLKFRKLYFFRGFLIFSIINFPWYLYILNTLPGLLHYFIYDQLLSRLGKSGQGHPRPFYYFLYIFPLLTLPWSFFIPSMIKERRLFTDDPVKRFFLVWTIIPLIFFSIPATKLGLYVLPAIPPFIILVSLQIKNMIESENSFSSGTVSSIMLIEFILGTSLIIYSQKLKPSQLELTTPILFTGILLCSVFILHLFFRLKDYKKITLLWGGILILALHLSFFTQINIFEKHFIKSFKPFTEFIKKESGNENFTVLQHRVFFPSFSFYLSKPSVLINFERDTRFDDEKVNSLLIETPEDLKNSMNIFKGRIFLVTNREYIENGKDRKDEYKDFKKKLIMEKRKIVLLEILR